MSGVVVEVKPRADGRYDIYVGDEGDAFLNSSQGYSNVEDAVAIVRKLWPAVPEIAIVNVATDGNSFVTVNGAAFAQAFTAEWAPMALRVTYRDGTTHTRKLR